MCRGRDGEVAASVIAKMKGRSHKASVENQLGKGDANATANKIAMKMLALKRAKGRKDKKSGTLKHILKKAYTVRLALGDRRVVASVLPFGTVRYHLFDKGWPEKRMPILFSLPTVSFP